MLCYQPVCSKCLDCCAFTLEACTDLSQLMLQSRMNCSNHKWSLACDQISQDICEHVAAAASHLVMPGCRELESSLDDLSEICRRNRHSMEAAVRALLPPELYQAAMPQHA